MNESVLTYLSGNLFTHCQTSFRDGDCLVERCPFSGFVRCSSVTRELWRNYILNTTSTSEEEAVMDALARTMKSEYASGETNLVRSIFMTEREWMSKDLPVHFWRRMIRSHRERLKNAQKQP